jgi:single stranded DNA-binding protein
MRVVVTQRIQLDGEWRDGETSFFKVNVWRGQAENLAESLSKGDRVMVTGRLRQRSWETPEGEKRSVTELEADEVGASLKWSTAKVERVSQRGNGDRTQGRERQAERGGDFNDQPLLAALLPAPSAPMACGPKVDQARPLAGAAALRLADLGWQGDPAGCPRQASPAWAIALLGGALAGSGPGTSPCIDGLSLVTGMVVPQPPAGSNHAHSGGLLALHAWRPATIQATAGRFGGCPTLRR